MNQSQTFHFYTKKLLDGLPYWFAMRRQAPSVGAEFLNLIGLHLADIKFLLDYGFEQTFISSCDERALDVVYKAIIPVHQSVSAIQSFSLNGRPLEVVEKINDFFVQSDTVDSPALCFVDTKRNIIYTRIPGYKTLTEDYGSLDYTVEQKSYRQRLYHHHVWNYLDEFGLLFDCQRLKNESNFQYKRRLLDVFKHPGGAHKEGLLFALGRELGGRRWLTWEDGTQPFILPNRMVALEGIEVDGVPVSLEQLEMTALYQVGLKADGVTRPRDISYVAGIELHQLYQYKALDYKLKRELLTLENDATGLFKKYVSQVRAQSPLTWGSFKWDEAYWNSADRTVSGDGCIPSLYDASIDGFKGFKRQS